MRQPGPPEQHANGPTLLFGAGPDSLPAPSTPGALGATPAIPRSVGTSPRAAVRRARRRRKAVQQRSRVRMRAGSEVLLTFLLLLGLSLVLIDLRTAGGAFAGVRSGATALFGPLQAGIDRVTDPTPTDLALRAQNEQLLARLQSSAADQSRLDELEQLLGLTSTSGNPVVAASVVAHDSGIGGVVGATIDRGSDDGIEVEQAVLCAGGLAGLVRTTGPRSAVVRFVTDAGFVAGGRLQGSGEAGIVRGTGSPDQLTMELLNPLAVVTAGELVVTYGSPGDRPFPPGITIATVTDPGDAAAGRRVVALRPAATPTAASVLAVVGAQRPAAAGPQPTRDGQPAP